MLSLLAAIIEFFAFIWSADKSMTENSLLGKSRFDREARGSWVTFGLICLVLLLLLTFARAVAGLKTPLEPEKQLGPGGPNQNPPRPLGDQRVPTMKRLSSSL